MALPKAVQAELDAAAAIEQQLAGVVAEPSQTEPEPTTAAPEATPEVSPQSQVAEPAPVTEETWEYKYRTLQRKYDVEVPRLHAELRGAQSEVQRLDAALKDAQKQRASATPEPTTVVTDKDREEFGEDLVNLQERIAKSVAEPLMAHINELTARLGQYESTTKSMETQQAVSAEERYFERLAGAVPSWEQINADPRWVEWLTGRYPGVAVTRQEQLNAARANLDVTATVEMFKAFEELTAQPKQANQNQTLQGQVAPPKSKASSAPLQDQSKRIWTQAEIAAALDPRRLREMSAEQVERVMSEIDAAAAEGRVR